MSATQAGHAHPVDRLWLAVSSPRATALLAILMALMAGVAAVVPQGWKALEIARFEHSQAIRDLVAWGLTDVFDSVWIRVVGLLLAANILAVILRTVGRAQADRNSALRVPRGAPHEAEITADLPERAVESVRESFRASLGASPIAEEVQGSKVTMVFDTAPHNELMPLLTHVGLVALVLGAGLAVEPPAISNTVVSAMLAVTDSRSGYTGYFDMAEGEPRQFFQWRHEFVLRDYEASRNGLGPAVRLERVLADQQRRSDFWVYQDAPAGFDERHRNGLVSIEAQQIGRRAAPGHGIASRPTTVLLVLGMAFLVLGTVASARPAGRIWAEVDGERVRLLGVPNREGDAAFSGYFGRLEAMSRHILRE